MRTFRNFILLCVLAFVAMPLPAQDFTKVAGFIKASCVRVTHTAYTVCYDTVSHCPAYVAWELTADNLAVNVASRTDEFLPDPDIPQTPPSSAYSHSGYDRGHMAPAADFKWSEMAMAESFYTSNICPQNNGLNAGAWLELEKACRRWAKQYDKVWIVCGPVFAGKKTPVIGRGGYSISVPEFFYKAVLRKYKGRYYSMGWLMPNRNAVVQDERALEIYALSVNNIEGITGLNLFCDLPRDVQEQVEANTDTKYWH